MRESCGEPCGAKTGFRILVRSGMDAKLGGGVKKRALIRPFAQSLEVIVDFAAHTLMMMGIHVCLMIPKLIDRWGQAPILFFGCLPASWIFDLIDASALLVIGIRAIRRLMRSLHLLAPRFYRA
jgi:hypothetical protein